MKSKSEILKMQKVKKDEEFQKYIKIMEKAIKANFPNGLDFDECPYVERLVYYRDVDIDFYTGYEKKIIEAIKETKIFKKIAKQLTENGYKFNLKAHVSYSNPSPEWKINLEIS